MHNDVGTWVETQPEIDRVFEALADDLLGASFDIWHLVWADVDPITMLPQYADRFIDIHIKDLNLVVAAARRVRPTGYNVATNYGVFPEPGLGGIDLDAVLAELPTDFEGWIVVEVDLACMDPAVSAEACWKWIAPRVR